MAAAAARCAASATAMALATAARSAASMGTVPSERPSEPLAAAFLPGLIVLQSCCIRLSAARALSFAVAAAEAVSRLVLFAAAAQLHAGWSSLLWSHALVFALRYSALCAYYKYEYFITLPRDCKNRPARREGGRVRQPDPPLRRQSAPFRGRVDPPLRALAASISSNFGGGGGASPYTLQ